MGRVLSCRRKAGEGATGEGRTIQDQNQIMKLDLFERYKGVTGVYWFKFREKVTYVGKANCILSRVKSHKNRFAGYSKFEALPCNKYTEKLSYLEATCFLKLCECYFIEDLNPIENKTRVNFMENWRKSVITHKRVYYLIEEVFSINDRMRLQ